MKPPSAQDGVGVAATPLRSAVPVRYGLIDAARLREVCTGIAAKGGRLAALWGSDERDRAEGFALNLALVADDAMLWIATLLPVVAPEYPDLADVFAAANRMQRATRDLIGLRAAAT